MPRPEMGANWYRFASCPVEPGLLRAHGGFSLVPDGGPELIEQADLIIVPGWRGADAPVPEDLLERLRQAHERGARLASICSGAFVLAATGLLDGRSLTTHWRHAEAIRRCFPAITVDEAALYRQEGTLFTSAGSAAGIDLMIEIVRQDFGPDAANSVARRIVMPAHRRGGQRFATHWQRGAGLHAVCRSWTRLPIIALNPAAGLKFTLLNLRQLPEGASSSENVGSVSANCQ